MVGLTPTMNDATEAEIDEAVWEWAIERVGTNWEVIE